MQCLTGLMPVCLLDYTVKFNRWRRSGVACVQTRTFASPDCLSQPLVDVGAESFSVVRNVENSAALRRLVRAHWVAKDMMASCKAREAALSSDWVSGRPRMADAFRSKRQTRSQIRFDQMEPHSSTMSFCGTESRLVSGANMSMV